MWRRRRRWGRTMKECNIAGSCEQVGIADNAQIRHLENDPGHNSGNDRLRCIHCATCTKQHFFYHDLVLFVALQAPPEHKI
eukprot:gene16769-biopygen21825